MKRYPSDKAVTFIWDKPVDLGDAEITGYQAAYRPAPDNCASPETVQWYNIYGSNRDTVYHTVIGHHTEGDVVKSGLKNGTRYGVALRALNQHVPGPGLRACLTPIAGVNPPPFVPPAPENLNLIRGDGTLTVTWYNSPTATGYQVDYSTDGGNTWKMAAWWDATTSIILNGMDNATTYTVKVRGRNDRGDGPWSDSVTDRPASTLSVSNLDQTNTVDGVVGKDAGVHTSQAAGFTTGANSSGYTLQSVTVKMADTVGSPTKLTVAIHAAASGVERLQLCHKWQGLVAHQAGGGAQLRVEHLVGVAQQFRVGRCRAGGRLHEHQPDDGVLQARATSVGVHGQGHLADCVLPVKAGLGLLRFGHRGHGVSRSFPSCVLAAQRMRCFGLSFVALVTWSVIPGPAGRPGSGCRRGGAPEHGHGLCAEAVGGGAGAVDALAVLSQVVLAQLQVAAAVGAGAGPEQRVAVAVVRGLVDVSVGHGIHLSFSRLRGWACGP